ncbi:MAG: hypothetical protein KAR09_10960, partial [Bacteroidales bacterium]|nr:hypothetical protein [Bacteroidales bacterium]
MISPVSDSIPDWYNHRLSDGGPIYTETGGESFLVEPWNALTSLLMLIPVLYWFIKLRKETGSF